VSGGSPDIVAASLPATRPTARRDWPSGHSARPLVLIVASLSPGGAERVVATMANHWAQRGRSVDVITIDGPGADFYALDPAVRRHALGMLTPSPGLRAAAQQNIRRIAGLRRAIVRSGADLVVSFVERTNVIVRLATIGLRVRVILAERTDPRAHRIGPIWDGLRRLTYPFADAIVVQTASVRDWAHRWLRAERVHVIPNPIDRVRWEAAADGPGRERMIVGMGRFTSEKGFDLLLGAFAALAPRHPDWRLILLGDGPLREELAVLARSLDLEARIEMPGTVPDPERYLRRAMVFALPSRFEGFPNALLEAMASGCAVVAADCPSGPRHIVRDGENGLLVAPDDAAALAGGLQRVLGDAPLRERLAKQATKVLDEYDLERIMGTWEQVLDGDAER
jgi:GalNAc-alpha-(1->4)-GalNAc-alpha-(1->3)-diNAcBac-PP-undecaprenol alpha-1,4-N-acetyl-D-galactosaminyltransferase